MNDQHYVPLELIISGKNTVKIENQDRKKRSCRLFSLEIVLYRQEAQSRK